MHESTIDGNKSFFEIFILKLDEKAYPDFVFGLTIKVTF